MLLLFFKSFCRVRHYRDTVGGGGSDDRSWKTWQCKCLSPAQYFCRIKLNIWNGNALALPFNGDRHLPGKLSVSETVLLFCLTVYTQRPLCRNEIVFSAEVDVQYISIERAFLPLSSRCGGPPTLHGFLPILNHSLYSIILWRRRVSARVSLPAIHPE